MCYTLKNISSYLGSPIPTDNGNQTMHEYDALGNRVRTTYYTRKSLTAVPIGNILHPENNTSDYTITVDGFNENIVYAKVNPAVCNGTTWMPKFVHNPEGMMRHYSYEEHYPFYFIKDHLGNIRETYIKPAPNTKHLIQRMQYYPSGIPWKTSSGAIEHPYRYNGKELVQMHGQDEYDSKARWYYPAICRTTTIDPLCEKYYNISPYAWCGNNFANVVDLKGEDIYLFDSVGNFTGTIIEQEGEHFGRIIISENVYEDFKFNDSADAERLCSQYSDMYFSFDGGMDKDAITCVTKIDMETINEIIPQDLPSYNKLHALVYALLESRMGKLDYANQTSTIIQTKPNSLFIPKDGYMRAYNNYDFGNYLWGKSMRRLGLSLNLSRIGAHLDNMLHNWFHLDARADQTAIINGYNSNIRR